jgi:hypothetical protein
MGAWVSIFGVSPAALTQWGTRRKMVGWDLQFFFPLHIQLPFVSLISEMQYIFLFNLTLITPVPEGAKHLYI